MENYSYIWNLEVIENKPKTFPPFAPFSGALWDFVSLKVVVHGNVILLSVDWLCLLKICLVKMAA